MSIISSVVDTLQDLFHDEPPANGPDGKVYYLVDSIKGTVVTNDKGEQCKWIFEPIVKQDSGFVAFLIKDEADLSHLQYERELDTVIKSHTSNINPVLGAQWRVETVEDNPISRKVLIRTLDRTKTLCLLPGRGLICKTFTQGEDVMKAAHWVLVRTRSPDYAYGLNPHNPLTQISDMVVNAAKDAVKDAAKDVMGKVIPGGLPGGLLPDGVLPGVLPVVFHNINRIV